MSKGNFVPASFTIGEKASVRFEGGVRVSTGIFVNELTSRNQQDIRWRKIQGFEFKNRK